MRGPRLRRRFASIPDALAYWARQTPSAPALTSEAGEETYAQLAAHVEETASGLGAAGVRGGDRVVIAGENSPDWVHLYLATLRLGAIACPANNRLNPAQFVDQVALLGAWVAVTDQAHDPLAAGCPPDRVLTARRLKASQGSDLPELGDAVSGDAVALVSFTSGTTSTPKGAVLTHGAVADACSVFAQVIDTDRSSSTLVMVPLFHNTGFVDQLGHMLVVGGRTDLLRRFRSADAIAFARRRSATFVTAVPSILRMIMVTDGAEAIFGPARDVLYGGSPMPRPWSAELLEHWPHLRLHHGYGLTEFGSACSFLAPELALDCGESVGQPAPGVELRLVEIDGGEVDTRDGSPAEIWVRGGTRMLEYYKQPELTAAKLSGDWLRTGDIGRVADGQLYLEGRVDDVINRGGEKILPSFVESRVAELDEVAQVIVFSVPDPFLQHRVVAALEVRPGRTFSAATAAERLRHHLPDYAVPERFIVQDSLPRTASGKLDRRAIRRAYEQQIEEQS